MANVDPQPRERKVEVLADSTDRYRARARGTAALLATASAALVVGLVFTPGTRLPASAQLVGLGAAAGYVIGTTVLVVASMMRIDDLTNPVARVFRSVFAPWRMSLPDADGANGDEARATQARKLRRRIALLMDVGMWVAAIATAGAMVAVGMAVVAGNERDHYSISRLDGVALTGECLSADEPLRGTISRGELLNGDSLVRIEVDPDSCEGDSSVVVRVPMSELILTDIAP